jgi:hypothetical protein
MLLQYTQLHQTFSLKCYETSDTFLSHNRFPHLNLSVTQWQKVKAFSTLFCHGVYTRYSCGHEQEKGPFLPYHSYRVWKHRPLR